VEGRAFRCASDDWQCGAVCFASVLSDIMVMTERTARISRYGIAGLGALVLALGTVAARSEQRVVRARDVHHYTKAKFKKVGDVAGHFKGTYAANGVTFHDDGTISLYTSKGQFDHVNREGRQWGFVYRRFEDGSTVVTRYQGRARRTKGGRVGAGSFSCVKGSGRFNGVRCHGKYTSRYLENDMTVTDWHGVLILLDPPASARRSRQ
jgi:hypothetical protein